MDTRQALRNQMRQQRRQLSQLQQQQAADKAAQRLINYCHEQSIKSIALYLSFDGELSTKTAIQRLWQQHINVCVPVIHPFSKHHLVFIEYTPTSAMQLNKFGIEEPVLECHKIVPKNELDVIVTPLVAFDRQGNRLGMGGGFYDRLLASDDAPTAIGYAHDVQRLESLPVASWDMPLPCIITPSHTYRF
ncbi:5-formyltetrahydrofolate cyclo-ligase [Paraferrimonas haliotis]|uniref:5-formyltetrahydrofolate cyclo-ligase n=1 Tax=Paraferrimonas haliotis TaxID=2013866 RepID=A0AA37TP32_9GAMM|nr:5-formyltetrahydrofolate cyclo-ligase [Paraferrimonas haliotis]GLS83040.1 5-formyltetrahydrofolate cyclo-ligase [Paraferrimonas haliotis]